MVLIDARLLVALPFIVALTCLGVGTLLGFHLGRTTRRPTRRRPVPHPQRPRRTYPAVRVAHRDTPTVIHHGGDR